MLVHRKDLAVQEKGGVKTSIGFAGNPKSRSINGGRNENKTFETIFNRSEQMRMFLFSYLVEGGNQPSVLHSAAAF
ncbi:MAG TPA: hypothetical protein DDZ51_09640 [Planctomycetaceae bacterium]|nr:hypothetical protein [Planctomycetaceae bacterium]